jgi:threonine/homoserine/homoserine lactone efflux protein
MTCTPGSSHLTCGVDMALVTKNALQHGRRSAIATALGVNLGIVVWTGAAALGLAALIAASAAAFVLLRSSSSARST